MKQSTPPKSTTLDVTARSNLWFYPGEELADGKMRVTLIGTGWGNVVTPSQKGPSVFVELGNEAKDSFVFDVGPGCILNYNAMEIPMSRMSNVFLSHLHMDHCSDLPFIYSFGPNLGDRFTPLKIHGPSGPVWPQPNSENSDAETVLGTRNLVEGMQKFTQWHTTSFSTMSSGAQSSYALKTAPEGQHDDSDDLDFNIFEFNYRLCNGVVYERDDETHGSIKITSFPALHIIDGAVSYRLEWIPAGSSETITLVYSGDTLPNEFMLTYGKGADLMIHETAPSISSVMNGANATEAEAEAIVSNSHTPAEALGYIFKRTQPRLGVTTHTPMDPRSVDEMITDVRKNWDKKYQIGADFMVFNVSAEVEIKTGERVEPTTRIGVPVDRAWPVRISPTKNLAEPPLGDPEDVDYLRKAISLDANSKNAGVIFDQQLQDPDDR